MSTRVAIYRRVSDLKQREGASLETQLATCRRFVESQPDWIVLYELEDVETGLASSREGYQRLMDLIRRRAIDVVVVWRLDRFGRDAEESIGRSKDLARARIRLVSATEGEQPRFVQELLFLLANEESRKLSERVRPNMRTRAEQGFWQGRPPTGMRLDPDRKGVLIAKEPEASVVRALFALAASGEYSWHQLTNRAAALTDGRMGMSIVVKRIIRNPVYAGVVRWNRTNTSKLDTDKPCRRDRSEWIEVRGLHEAIVDPELWQAAQDAMAHRKGPRPLRDIGGYLLTGLVRCGECGGAMQGHMYTGNFAKQATRAPQWYYECRRPGHPGKGGKGVERAVLEAIRALPLAADSLERTMARLERSRPPSPAADEREWLAERLDRATDAMLDGTLSREQYRRTRADLEARIERLDAGDAALATWRRDLEASLRQLRAFVASQGGDILAALDGASMERRREAIGTFIRHVEIHKGRPPLVIWQPWAERLLAASSGE